MIDITTCAYTIVVVSLFLDIKCTYFYKEGEKKLDQTALILMSTLILHAQV